jgi:hypothetical protein
MTITYVFTDIQSLRDPVGWNTTGECCAQTIDVARRGATVRVHVTGQTALVVGIANQEDTANGVEGSSRDLGQRVGGGGSTLGVSFQDEAFVGIGTQARVDAANDLNKSQLDGGLMKLIQTNICSSTGAVLGEARWVYAG